jgi:hypothetical protein
VGAHNEVLDRGGVVENTAELLSRARQRTLEELNTLSCNDSTSYAVAISGNTPHVTLPNGITIVMRKCGTWAC